MLVLSCYLRLSINIRSEIRHQEIVIAADQHVAHPSEQSRLAGTESIGRQLIEHPLESRVSLVIVARPVCASQSQILDLFSSQAKDEYVLRADRSLDLDIRAIQRPDRQRAVHRELHVAGPRRFAAGS